MGARDFDKEHREDPLWYKDAIIYQLHVKAFFDSDNDGMGNFKGPYGCAWITSRTLASRGLAPALLPSPMRDTATHSEYRSHPTLYHQGLQAFVRRRTL